MHKTHLLVVAHAQFISREVTKKIIEATELYIIHKMANYALEPYPLQFSNYLRD